MSLWPDWIHLIHGTSCNQLLIIDSCHAKIPSFVLHQMHRELAREAVRKSLVLLKNGKDPKNPFLPLDKNARRILVTGIHADDIGYQCGGWTITWHGSSGRITIGTHHMMSRSLYYFSVVKVMKKTHIL